MIGLFPYIAVAMHVDTVVNLDFSIAFDSNVFSKLLTKHEHYIITGIT